MSDDCLRAMLSEATPGWRAGVRYPESLSVGGRHVFHTRMKSEADARLAALAPDAIALLASEEFTLLLRWVAILYREVEDGGRANDEMVPIRASDLYNLGQAAEPVRAALDALLRR